MAIGVVVCLAGLVVILNLARIASDHAKVHDTSHLSSGSESSITLPIKPGEPCYGAERHTPQELAATASVPLWMPDSPAASPSNPISGWTGGLGTERTKAYTKGRVLLRRRLSLGFW